MITRCWNKFVHFSHKHWFTKPLGSQETHTFSINKFVLSAAPVVAAITILVMVFLGTRNNSNAPSSTDESADTDDGNTSAYSSQPGTSQDGMLVLSFEANESRGGSSYTRTSTPIAFEGTLVRVRLQNTLETFESVPVFVQVIDYALGNTLYGATLIGEATGDSSSGRIKMSFSTLKPKNSSTAPKEFSGRALSLDGTLGIRADKSENLMNRSLLRGGSNLLGEKVPDSISQGGGISGLLTKALIRGLQEEGSLDLGVHSNRAAVLELAPGAEFYVQLTESLFSGGSK